MSEVQAAARQQQRVEELCVAAIRALSGQHDLHFRGRRLHRGRQRLPLFAPHLHPTQEHDDFASFRGAADGLALRLRSSDEALHAKLAPHEPVPHLLFDMLEQFRVEAGAGAEWPGVRHNLQHRFEQWTLAFHHAGGTDSARGLLLFTVAQIARSRVSAVPPLEDIEDLMEATRAGIAPLLGHGLAGLRRARHDQAAYAEHALLIAHAVARLLEEAGADESSERSASEHETDERLVFGLLMDKEDSDEASDAIAEVQPGRSRVLEASTQGYRVFTTAYDRELRPAALMRKAQLDDYRQRLDARVLGQGLNIARLSRELKALLATETDDGWASAQEDGLIDGRRLAQLVASPTERRLFRQELREPQADCVVAFLIDCSGSMRQHIEAIALLVDVFARALDGAGVASEVLGFTTGAWNGGRALRDWQRAGRPPHPGRLNEAAHLIFKDGDTPWRHARRGIAALLQAELFREGIDGEALAWAAARLQTRSEPRRVLIAISDGCPMDGATGLANDANYLDHHLQQIAGQIEAEGAIELCAIGVGLDLSPYYGRCQAIDLDAGLSNRLFHEIVGMIGRRAKR
jgi:cobaltochelatase CobT